MSNNWTDVILSFIHLIFDPDLEWRHCFKKEKTKHLSCRLSKIKLI